jgi:hypothetical protein
MRRRDARGRFVKAGRDVHSHKCKKCERVWTHDRPVGATEQEYEKAHTCTCGAIQYYRHREGPMPPPDLFERLLFDFLAALIKSQREGNRRDAR